jgi:hypothetical protein
MEEQTLSSSGQSRGGAQEEAYSAGQTWRPGSEMHPRKPTFSPVDSHSALPGTPISVRGVVGSSSHTCGSARLRAVDGRRRGRRLLGLPFILSSAPPRLGWEGQKGGLLQVPLAQDQRLWGTWEQCKECGLK